MPVNASNPLRRGFTMSIRKRKFTTPYQKKRRMKLLLLSSRSSHLWEGKGATATHEDEYCAPTCPDQTRPKCDKSTQVSE